MFFRGFNRVFGRATDGYVGTCKHLIHKAGFAFVLLALLVLAAGFFGKKIPKAAFSLTKTRDTSTRVCNFLTRPRCNVPPRPPGK